MEVIFKKLDNVYHIQYGWGKVTDIIDHDGLKYVQCNFPFGHKQISFAINNKLKNLLSFTEYKLEGFSDKRPEELPKIGQVVWVRDEIDEGWRVAHFLGKKGNFYVASLYYLDQTPPSWNYMTTENPYENEQ